MNPHITRAQKFKQRLAVVVALVIAMAYVVVTVKVGGGAH